MIVSLTQNFISDAQNPNNKLTIFYARLYSSRFSNVNSSESYIPVAVDVVNENYYALEITDDIIKYYTTVDGVKLSLYDYIKLFYTINDSDNKKLAATIKLYPQGDEALFDYARNIIYLNLTNKKFCAKFTLIKIDILSSNVGGVVLSHKHNLVEDNILTDNNTHSSEYLVNFIQDNNPNPKVGYLSKPFPKDHYFSHRDAIYNIPSSVYSTTDDSNINNDNNGVTKLCKGDSVDNVKTPDYGNTASTQDIYQFKNGILTPFGLTLKSIGDNLSNYELCNLDLSLLVEQIIA